MDQGLRARMRAFLNVARLVDLKEKLLELKLSTQGQKAVLKLRLENAWNQLPQDELVKLVPENLTDVGDESSGGEDTEAGEIPVSMPDNATIDLDGEIARLKEEIAKKKQIAQLRKELDELTLNDDTSTASKKSAVFHFRDIEESLTRFSGDDFFPVQKWVQEFEEAAEFLQWDYCMCFVYSKRLLVGTAKLFLKTVNVKSWQELKNALLKEFSKTVTRADIYNELRNRRKKKEESYQQYILVMQEIASLAEVEEVDLVHFVIDGIQDTASNKMLLYNAENISELKIALKKYGKMKSSSLVSFSHEESRSVAHRQVERRVPAKPKCFNCNEFGHLSADCQRPRRDPQSCYACGKSGHNFSKCPRKSTMLVERVVDSSNVNDIREIEDVDDENSLYQGRQLPW